MKMQGGGKGADGGENDRKDAAAGQSLLAELSVLGDIGPGLSPMAEKLRRRWIKQYDLKTVPELMLVDQAILSYFYSMLIGKKASRCLRPDQAAAGSGPQQAGRSVPAADGDPQRPPPADTPPFPPRGAGEVGGPPGGQEVEDFPLTLVARFNRMFLRNLWAMRRCNTRLTPKDLVDFSMMCMGDADD